MNGKKRIAKWTALLLSLLLVTGLVPVSVLAGEEATEYYCPESWDGEHSWSEPEILEEATCQDNGMQVRHCYLCGYELFEQTPQTFHQYGSFVTIQEATCTEEGVVERTCKICGGVDRQPLEKADHKFGEKKITKEATCTSTGLMTMTCSVCGETVEETIPKKSHSYGSWKILKEASDFAAGTKERVCQNCGDKETVNFDPEGTLRRGDAGDAVEAFQEMLNEAGYDCGYADGIFGGMTEAAVIALEAANGLTQDGIGWPGVQKLLKGAPGGGIGGPSDDASMKLSGDAIPVQSLYDGKVIPVSVTLVNTGKETLHGLDFVYDSGDSIVHESWMDSDLTPGNTNTFTYKIHVNASDVGKDWSYRYLSAKALSPADTEVWASYILIFAQPKGTPSILLVPSDTTGMAITPGGEITVPLYVFNNGNTDLYDLQFALKSCKGSAVPSADDCTVPAAFQALFHSSDAFIIDYKITADPADVAFAAIPSTDGGGGGFIDRVVEISAKSDLVSTVSATGTIDSESGTTVKDVCDMMFQLYIGETEEDEGPTPTPVPVTPTPMPEKTDVCSRTLNGKGHAIADYTRHICETHVQAAKEVKDLLDSASTDEQKTNAYVEAQGIWCNEINAMYQSLADSRKTEEEKAIVLEDKDLFYDSVFAYTKSLELIYPDDLLQRMFIIEELYRDKCVDLCYEIHTAPAKRVDSYLRDYTNMEDGQDSPACTRTLEEEMGFDIRYHENLSTDHAVIEDMVIDLFEKAGSAQEICDICTVAQRFWKLELQQIASVREITADDAGKEVIRADAEAFEKALAARDTFLKLLYPDNPEIVSEVITKTIMNRVLDYCEAMNTVG